MNEVDFNNQTNLLNIGKQKSDIHMYMCLHMYVNV